MVLSMFSFLEKTGIDKPLGGRYKIIRQLGAGGFGTTFLAQDLHLPKQPQCVVKLLKPQVSDAAIWQTARRLFETEAQVMCELGNHPQIPRLLAHFKENKQFYLVQELIDGEPLSQELMGGKRWQQNQVILLLRDILQVLDFVHQQQVIHRDIKPANLMRRRRDGKIVLIDFGAVKQLKTVMIAENQGITNHTISIGSQGYMPKEQLGGNPRFSSDVYAVGMVGIQALTGVHPSQLPEDPETGEIMWRAQAPAINPELADILDTMVRYDFRTRYANAGSALAALARLPTKLEFEPLSKSSISESTELVTYQNVVTTPTETSPVSLLNQATEVVCDNKGNSFKVRLILATIATIGTSFWLPQLLANIPFTQQVQGWIPKKTIAENSVVYLPVSQSYNQVFLNKAKSKLEPPKSQIVALYNQTYQETESSAITWNADLTTENCQPCHPSNFLEESQEETVVFLNTGFIPQQPQDTREISIPEKSAAFLNPDFAAVGNNYGKQLSPSNHSAQTVNYSPEATSFKPESADALVNLAIALWDLKRFNEARVAIDQALEIQPQHPVAKQLSRQMR